MNYVKTCSFLAKKEPASLWIVDEADLRCIKFKLSLKNKLERLVEEGFKHFASGMEIGADIYFAETAIALREAGAAITVGGISPFEFHAALRPENDRLRYYAIAEKMNDFRFISLQYTDTCYQERDEMLMYEADFIFTEDADLSAGKKPMEYLDTE